MLKSQVYPHLGAWKDLGENTEKSYSAKSLWNIVKHLKKPYLTFFSICTTTTASTATTKFLTPRRDVIVDGAIASSNNNSNGGSGSSINNGNGIPKESLEAVVSIAKEGHLLIPPLTKKILSHGTKKIQSETP
jgi:hypothetical protein